MAKEKENSPESVVRKIKRNTRKKFGAEEKIRIVLEGMTGKTATEWRYDPRSQPG